MKDDNLDEEVRFWRNLIEWWETNKSESAPQRMYQALELAKLKVGYMQIDVDYTKRH